MNLSFYFQEDPGCLVCSITGKWVTDELKGFIDKASAEVNKQGHSRLLADMSLVSGPPPEFDRFNPPEADEGSIPRPLGRSMLFKIARCSAAG